MVIISALALAGAAPENAAPPASPTSASSQSSGGSNSSKSGALLLSLLKKCSSSAASCRPALTRSKLPNGVLAQCIANLGCSANYKVHVVGSNILCCPKNAQACWPTLQAPRVVCLRAKTLSWTARWQRRRTLSSRRWTRGLSSRHTVQNCCP